MSNVNIFSLCLNNYFVQKTAIIFPLLKTWALSHWRALFIIFVLQLSKRQKSRIRTKKLIELSQFLDLKEFSSRKTILFPSTQLDQVKSNKTLWPSSPSSSHCFLAVLEIVPLLLQFNKGRNDWISWLYPNQLISHILNSAVDRNSQLPFGFRTIHYVIDKKKNQAYRQEQGIQVLLKMNVILILFSWVHLLWIHPHTALWRDKNKRI